MKFNHAQLTFAREFRALSQTELSKRIKGLSQSNLSKFEKGIESLSKEIIDKLVLELDFPIEFFEKRISNEVENAHYRKRATLTKGERSKLEYGNKLIGYIIDQMSDSIEWPNFTLYSLNLDDGYTPEISANFIRKALSISPHEPIANINYLLEKSGIIIVEINAHDKFDGVSFLTDMTNPVIIVNKNIGNDRKRFTLAHELGHIVMHLNNPVADFRDKELEANRFASEFLMPSSYIKNSLYNLRLSSLAELKKYWLTSKASIIMRAKVLGCINARKYRYLNIELSRNGEKKKEQIEVHIDTPKLFTKGVELHRLDLDYSLSDISKAFHLPEDIIATYFQKHNSNKSKLRVVI